MDRLTYQLWGARATAKRGNQLPHARLTPEAVREIRENRQGLTAAQLAAQYGVHHRTIEKVRAYETWSHA